MTKPVASTLVSNAEQTQEQTKMRPHWGKLAETKEFEPTFQGNSGIARGAPSYEEERIKFP